jgi:hypothetical protein
MQLTVRVMDEGDAIFFNGLRVEVSGYGTFGLRAGVSGAAGCPGILYISVNQTRTSGTIFFVNVVYFI